MERYVCIHGHFYQPPRENPWLEAIEVQDSAYPYHDWNERITVECYAPNGRARILDNAGYIEKIVNNYARMSFNFGPTLLAWMAESDPLTYQGILDADRESSERFGGHGSALAQAYNHMIMPLANQHDKRTQVIWGIRDFESRFGRKPEGMWLPETAVDLATLEHLVDQGIRFTVLSPYQARRVRPLGGRHWRDASNGRIDPSMAYRLRLPSRRTIDLFYYDGPISRAVAFEGLLNKGEYLSGRLLSAFSDSRTWPQLVHIATDGETYGHHHVHGDMALAYALNEIENHEQVSLTNYGEFLEKHPPTQESEIFENSSWSCVHGVERWRSNCGCNTGVHPGWNQEWRSPLREALDRLRDSIAPRYEEEASKLLRDPWEARDEYVGVLLDRSRDNVEPFFTRQARRELSEDDKVRALKLLELQRHAMLMYTSCGWFFDELSGIETVQVMQYAGRVLQLSAELLGDHLEAEFLEHLGKAKSNVPEFRDGKSIYAKSVNPARVDLQKAGAHYAVSSMFEEYSEQARIFCYTVERKEHKLLQAGKTRLALGRARVASEITWESEEVTYGIVHFGDHSVSGGIRSYRDEEAYQALVHEVSTTFSLGDVAELIRVVDKNFGSGTYSLRLLFRDEQRRVLGLILDSTLAEAEALYRSFYEDHAPLMRFVTELGMPLPERFKIAAEVILNTDLGREFESPKLDRERIQNLLEEATNTGALLNRPTLQFTLRKTLQRVARDFRKKPENRERLKALEDAVELVRSLPFEVDMWKVQNLYYEVMQGVYPRLKAQLTESNPQPREWLERVTTLGGKLHMRVPLNSENKNS